jgi:site-specific DNA-methyltransferase (adenine-specific)
MNAPYTLIHGDCITEMSKLPANSVDAIVTDPPYGIRFMGKAWDGADIDARAARRRSFASQAPDAGPNGGHKSIAAEAGKYNLAPGAMRAFQEFSEEWAREAFRVLKPGGHLLSFSSARTYHRMVSGIEDAGFEIRDQLLWLYGSGFPKSRNLDGVHEGWGTALKPAHEPICMARKPLIGTVSANVLAHGTGAINIDACRVGAESTARDTLKELSSRGATGGSFANQDHRYADRTSKYPTGSDAGRWPANLIHDGSAAVVALFPAEAGAQAPVHRRNGDKFRNLFGKFEGNVDEAGSTFQGDTGSAARFFYCAKASRTDRNEGLPSGDAPAVETDATMRDCENADWIARNGNHHPTVKPTDLMAYLVRLVTPPGGTVLDPFMGSGSTGKACMREEFHFIGIELAASYIEISQARISHELARVIAANTPPPPSPQMDLFGAMA